jgi:hypothetical protein
LSFSSSSSGGCFQCSYLHDTVNKDLGIATCQSIHNF